MSKKTTRNKNKAIETALSMIQKKQAERNRIYELGSESEDYYAKSLYNVQLKALDSEVSSLQNFIKIMNEEK